MNTSWLTFNAFTGFDAPSLNARGQVAFHVVSTAGANDGVYLDAADVNPVAIALKNDSSPGGGVFKTFGDAALINDSGRLAFHATSAMTDGSTPAAFSWRTTGPIETRSSLCKTRSYTNPNHNLHFHLPSYASFQFA